MADIFLTPVYEAPPAPDLQLQTPKFPDFNTPEMARNAIINPFVNPVSSPFPILYDVIINPYEESTSQKPFGFGVFHNGSNQTEDSGFKYNKFYLTRVVMIPSIILMIVFSLLLVYIIMRHLRSIMKLYMSVIFYALSILYFAIQIIILLLYDKINPGKIPDCDSAPDQMFISFQLTGIIMPAMAVLTVTVVRVVFLKSPFRWRELLTYRNQLIGFSLAVLVTFILGFLPLLQLCELEMVNNQCVLVKSWTVRCVACFILSCGVGLVAPKLAVALMYCIIYGIVKEAREVNRALSTKSTSLSKKSETEPLTSSSELEPKAAAKDRKVKTERESFPWSIVVILLLNIASAIPWVILISAPELIYKKRDSRTFFLLDILYSVLLIATAASPIAYLLTTKVVRDTTFGTLKGCFRAMFCCE